MNEKPPVDNQAKTLLGAMTELKSRHYVLPRYIGLEKAFESVLTQFISAHLAGLHHEGRGLILTGGTRAGKSHDIKYLLRAFAEAVDPLQGGFERKYVRVSLRATASWKHLGSALLKALNYPADLDHRSADMVWRRVEGLLKKGNVFVVHIDEFQHLLMEKSPKEINTILNGLKDLMKRPDWPVFPIISGVPELLDFVNTNDQLTALLEPVTFSDIPYSEASLNEIDKIVYEFSEIAGLDASEVRNEDVYNRMIHASVRRWGRLFELIIHTLAHTSASGRTQVKVNDFAETFHRWTGVPPGANVFLIGNPDRVPTNELYRA
jgi:Cdc6-like AAA superfamily ATPase